jgi:hypothetical protein
MSIGCRRRRAIHGSAFEAPGDARDAARPDCRHRGAVRRFANALWIGAVSGHLSAEYAGKATVKTYAKRTAKVIGCCLTWLMMACHGSCSNKTKENDGAGWAGSAPGTPSASMARAERRIPLIGVLTLLGVLQYAPRSSVNANLLRGASTFDVE